MKSKGAKKMIHKVELVFDKFLEFGLKFLFILWFVFCLIVFCYFLYKLPAIIGVLVKMFSYLIEWVTNEFIRGFGLI